MPDSFQKRPKPVVLIILDGWGVAPPSRGNAIWSANTPTFDSLVTSYVATTIRAAGEAVGLPWGEQGNSEVGHMHIGAGRIVYQDLLRINRAIEDRSFFHHPSFLRAIDGVIERKGALHLVGMISNGGVHASLNHLLALVTLAVERSCPQVYIHAILDGRDVPYRSGIDFLKNIEERITAYPSVVIASVLGRFYAMDRDTHWDRTQVAYDLIARGAGESFRDAIACVAQKYAHGIFDEHMDPLVWERYPGLRPEDAVIFTNFRPDRARQLTKAFTSPGFDQFPVVTRPQGRFVTMTKYDQSLHAESAFLPDTIHQGLCEVIAAAGLSQLHIAETEKYAHITYFLNGGREEPFERQHNVLVPTPVLMRHDENPALSAREITKRVIEEIRAHRFDFYVINFANADLVGHTGNIQATQEAVEVIDECLKKIVGSVLERTGVVCITADHGNAETKIEIETGEISKGHTSSPVPFVVVGGGYKRVLATEGKPDLSLMVPSGVLADVAPTILKIMNLPKPKSMIGRALI